jgi:hypothetical protein
MTEIEPPDLPTTRTVGGFDRAGRVWVLTLFGIGGVAVGAILPPLARWAAELPWVPFEGPIRLLGSFDDAWLVWGRPVLGLVAGLAFAGWVIVDSPRLAISREQVEVRRRGQVERVIARATVASVRPRGAKILVEAESGRTLFEDDVEGDRSAIRSAFVDLGYPWEGPLK